MSAKKKKSTTVLQSAAGRNFSLFFWKSVMLTPYPRCTNGTITHASSSLARVKTALVEADNPIPGSRMEEIMKTGQRGTRTLSLKESLQKNLLTTIPPSPHWPISFHMAKARKSSLHPGPAQSKTRAPFSEKEDIMGWIVLPKKIHWSSHPSESGLVWK